MRPHDNLQKTRKNTNTFRTCNKRKNKTILIYFMRKKVHNDTHVKVHKIKQRRRM